MTTDTTPHAKYIAALEEITSLEKASLEEQASLQENEQARQDALLAAASESKISKTSLTKAIEADMAAKISAMRESNTSSRLETLRTQIEPLFLEACRAVRFRLDAWFHEWRRKELVRILGEEAGQAAFARTVPNDAADRLIESMELAKLYHRHGSDGVNAPQSEPAYRTAYKDAFAFIEEQEAAIKA